VFSIARVCLEGVVSELLGEILKECGVIRSEGGPESNKY